MWKFVATSKRFLWSFVELAFLAVLALILLSLLLGQSAGPYVNSVADNVAKFATSTSSGLIGVVIVLALLYLAARRQGLT
jgi:ABC-type dipeptide/oligopeptide/nickel transport system permease component